MADVRSTEYVDASNPYGGTGYSELEFSEGKASVRHIRGTLAVTAVTLAAVTIGCSSGGDTVENQATVALEAIEGEHARDTAEVGGEGAGEHGGERSGEHGEEGEESGTEYALNQTYDQVRNGARLILTYDAESNSFVGTVENTTEETLRRVRVEVHLSNGVELGPTNTADLTPGEKRAVKLTATSTNFDKWSAHPEVGGGEGG